MEVGSPACKALGWQNASLRKFGNIQGSGLATMQGSGLASIQGNGLASMQGSGSGKRFLGFYSITCLCVCYSLDLIKFTLLVGADQ